MLQGLDQSEFGQFVSDLWERQGWQTQVKRDDGRVFVAVQRPATDEEGLVWALADDGEVGGQQVQQFASQCEEYGVGEGAIATTGSLSDHAEKVAEGSRVELLDGDGIARILRRKEWTDLAEQYGGGGVGASGEGGNTEDEDADSAFGRLRGLLTGASVPTKPALAVVVVVALLAAGVLAGLPIPFVGGASSPVSAESVTPANSTTTLSVTWNAEVVEKIDPNESDDVAYYAPPDEQFVLVELAVNNTGDGEVELNQSAFKLRTDERTYRYQPFRAHDGFVSFAISPGTRYGGWTAFSVPERTTGTLIYDQNATDRPVTVEFTRDSDMAVNVTRR